MAYMGCYLDKQPGIAVDSDEKGARHQIVTAKKVRKTGQTIIHYTVYYAHAGHDLMPPNLGLISMMDIETPEDPEEKKKLEKAYEHLLAAIRPQRKNQAFKVGELAKAVTYDLYFDHAARFEVMDMRATFGYMTGAITNQQAHDKAFHEPPKNRSLRLWHDTISTFMGADPDDPVSFSTITNETTKLIQQQTLLLAVAKNLDCIYRCHVKDAPHIMLDQMRQYGSELTGSDNIYGSVMAAQRVLKDQANTQGVVVPATAARTDVDSVNIAVQHEMFVNPSKTPFPEGTAAAVAHFKRHTDNWKAMGLA